jgi:hypothetical protein
VGCFPTISAEAGEEIDLEVGPEVHLAIDPGERVRPFNTLDVYG